MTIQQESKSKMYHVVIDYLISNSELTKDLPEFTGNFTAFQNVLNELDRISELQNFDKTGYAKEKKQLRDVLLLLAYDNSQKLAAYANLSNDKVLHTEIRFTKSDLREANEPLLKDYAKMVYDRAQTYLGSLAAYGITQETQSVLLNAIDAYNISISKPRLGMTEKSAATKQLAELFKTADGLLNKIDSVINILMTVQPSFYNRYKEVRRVVITGAGSLALKASASEVPGGTPLKGVKFTFSPEGVMMTGSSVKEELVKKTADKGNFYLKSIPEGTYKVKITKTGFKEKEVKVNIVPGEMAELNVEMEKVKEDGATV